MSKYLLDSYGWIEFLVNGPKAKSFKDAIASDSEIIVSSIVLAEVAAKFHVSGQGEDAKKVIASIRQRAQVIDISDQIADAAGRIWAENRSKGMGLADAVIMATALQENSMVLTGDSHFKGFRNAKVV